MTGGGVYNARVACAVGGRSMTDQNAGQIAFWNAAAGQQWADDANKLDIQMAELAAAIVAAAGARPGESVIDIGCGAGGTALMLADAVGSTGSVVGVDVSEPLLTVARQRARGRDNVVFRQGDAARDLPPASADLIFSKFGVMFFDDPEAAFRTIHRAVKPGGRIAFLCWRAIEQNPFAQVPTTVALKHLPPQDKRDPYAPGPFAFADQVRVGHILMQAGFQAPTIAEFDTRMVIAKTAAEAAATSIKRGVAAFLLVDASQETKDAIQVDMVAAYQPYETAAGIDLPARCWIVTASA